SPARPLARRLITLATLLASLSGWGFCRRAPAFLHAGGEGAPAARGFVLARDRLVGVIARRHCDGEDDEHAERAQAALRTSHHPALRRPASPPQHRPITAARPFHRGSLRSPASISARSASPSLIFARRGCERCFVRSSSRASGPGIERQNRSGAAARKPCEAKSSAIARTSAFTPCTAEAIT